MEGEEVDESTESKYILEDVIDEGEIPSLKPSQLLQFIEDLRLDGEL